MDYQSIEALLQKYRLGLCTDEEKSILEQWYDTQDVDKSSIDLFALKEQGKEKLFSQIDIVPTKRLKRRLFWIGASAVAAAALVALITILPKNNRTKNLASIRQLPIALRYHNDVPPADTSAELIKANGEKTIINTTTRIKGYIYDRQSKRLIISSQEDPKLDIESLDNKIITHRGQFITIELPDHSKVWLNSESELQYSTPFSDSIRHIWVKGEAYFEVAKNKELPFVVSTDHGNISVLGTHFSVHDYGEDSSFCTTLLSGKIAFTEYSSPAKTILKPSQRLSIQKGKLQLSTVKQLDKSIEWKNGYFDFTDMDIKSVMQQLSRWYDIQVVYSQKKYDLKFFGELRRDQPLSQILKILEQSGAHFSIDKKKVTVL